MGRVLAGGTPSLHAMSATRKRQRMTTPRPAKPKPEKPPEPLTFTLDLDQDELLFLSVILAQAQVGPAKLKQVCGRIQERVEEMVAVLPKPEG